MRNAGQSRTNTAQLLARDQTGGRRLPGSTREAAERKRLEKRPREVVYEVQAPSELDKHRCDLPAIELQDR